MRKALLKMSIASFFLYAALSGSSVELQAEPGDCDIMLGVCEHSPLNCQFSIIGQEGNFLNYKCDCGNVESYGWCEV